MTMVNSGLKGLNVWSNIVPTSAQRFLLCTVVDKVVIIKVMVSYEELHFILNTHLFVVHILITNVYEGIFHN